MDSYVLVNIFNEGFINWIGEVGPVFGYSLPIGILDLIRMDPLIKMEVTTPEGARNAKIKYLKEKEEKVRAMMGKRKAAQAQAQQAREEIIAGDSGDSFEPKEELKITVTTKEEPKVEEVVEEVEEVKEDADIVSEDAAEAVEETVDDVVEESEENLDESIDNILENSDTSSVLDSVVITKKEVSEEETAPVKKYTTKQLTTKTKKELKDILIERGYTTGMWAPKYHDTLSDLIRKIQKTQ